MKKLVFLSVFLLGIVGGVNAQFNDYKYIIVPIKFSAFKNQNEHQTSTLIKYHIAKNGFNVVYDNALPEDVTKNRCLGLYVDFIDKSSLFTTKAFLEFKKCDGTVVFTTKEGRTKIKEFKGAYSAVIEQAASSLTGKKHEYKEKAKQDMQAPVETPMQKISEKELIATKDATTEKVMEQGNVVKEEMVETVSEKVAPKKELAEQNNSSKTTTPSVLKNTNLAADDVLYAQPIANGYQLVDTTPAVRYILEATSLEDVFLVNQEGVNGVVLKKDGQWYLEYKGPNGKVSEALNIKF